MKEYDILTNLKRCKIYLIIYRVYYVSFLIISLIISYIPYMSTLRNYCIAGLIVFAVVGIMLKIYIQYYVLKCPFCGTLFTTSNSLKMLSNIPRKCHNCDRVLNVEET